MSATPIRGISRSRRGPFGTFSPSIVLIADDPSNEGGLGIVSVEGNDVTYRTANASYLYMRIKVQIYMNRKFLLTFFIFFISKGYLN